MVSATWSEGFPVSRNLDCFKSFTKVIFLCVDLDSFPVMMRQDADGTASTERRAAGRRAAEYVHDTEIIFIMPSLQMHLKTEHLQGEHEPQDEGMFITYWMWGTHTIHGYAWLCQIHAYPHTSFVTKLTENNDNVHSVHIFLHVHTAVNCTQYEWPWGHQCALSFYWPFLGVMCYHLWNGLD